MGPALTAEIGLPWSGDESGTDRSSTLFYATPRFALSSNLQRRVAPPRSSMKRSYLLIYLLIVILVSGVIATTATADASHARIVRLSLLQGDVRFTQQFHADSLTDTKAGWETAMLNLPIRQGFAIATGADGRAEVEFENGAMAVLSANT